MDGYHQLFVQDLASQLITQVSTVNSDVSAVTAGVSDDVYFTQAGQRLFAQAPDFKPYSALPLDSIVCWGDSLTAGSGGGGGGYVTKLGSAAGVAVKNEGIGGQNSSYIAARAGGKVMTVEAELDSIPGAVAEVVLTSVNQKALSNQGWQFIPGTINGVSGVMARQADDSLVFTRDEAGTAIDTTGGVVFAPNVGDEDQRHMCIWVGRNNTTNTQTVLDDVAGIVATIKNKARRFVVLAVINGGAEYTGTTKHTEIVVNINTALQAAYPNNFVDVRQPLVDGYDVNIQTDVDDFNGDTVPGSLRTDGVHLTTPGYQIVADTVFNFMKNKGWF